MDYDRVQAEIKTTQYEKIYQDEIRSFIFTMFLIVRYTSGASIVALFFLCFVDVCTCVSMRKRKEKRRKKTCERGKATNTCGLFHPSVLAIEKKKKKKDDMVADASLSLVPKVERSAFFFVYVSNI